MAATWLSSILNLLTFFRCTLIWVDINLCAFGIFSGWLTAFMVLGLSAVTFIFNVTVCVLEHKAKKRARQLGVAQSPLPPKMSVICLDFFFGLAYMVTFILYIIGSSYYDADIGYYRFSIFTAQAYVGTLVACHYHLFFASVSLHSWRQHQRGIKARQSTELRMSDDLETRPGTQVDVVNTSTK